MTPLPRLPRPQTTWHPAIRALIMGAIIFVGMFLFASLFHYPEPLATALIGAVLSTIIFSFRLRRSSHPPP